MYFKQAPMLNRHINRMLIALFCAGLDACGRIFLVGSNPNLTIMAFPQDIFKLPADMAFYYISYENKPWWGDVDDPPNKPMNESANRPNNTYLATGESVSTTGGDSFEHNAAIHSVTNQVGFNRTLNENLRTRFDVRYSGYLMTSKASGDVQNIVFNYSEKNYFHDAYLTSILGVKIGQLPFGVKLGLGGVYTTEPGLDFTTNAPGVSTNRLYWGWSALQGQNVFNTPEAVAHAETQDQYSIGPLYELDIQPGVTLPKLYLGGRFRYHFGTLRTFNWHDDIKSYVQDESDKIRNITGRLYGNYIWSQADNYRFATLALSRYTYMDSIQTAVDNASAQSGQVRSSANFVFQVNPNLCIYPWKYKQTYIDMAILCNYSYTGYAHTVPYWVNGGQIRSYVNTTGYAGDDAWWQECSYFHQTFFEVALDLNPVFPVYGDKEQSAAVGALMMVWTRFKWLNKYYGSNAISGSDINFDVATVRHNFDHEVWLNSMLNFIYRRGSVMWRLDVGEPLIYSLTPRTRVTDANGKTVLYEKKLENMWVSQSGVKIGLFVTTTLDNVLGMASKLKGH
jgi:hypothetical protein